MAEPSSLPSLQPTLIEMRSTDPGIPVAPATSDPPLFERLGLGGMGEVYRCGDDALQRDLALKVLRADLRGDAAAEARFVREAQLTGSLQHPGIVPIHQLSRLADGRPCYTMKLIRGRTLADILREEAVGPDRLARLLGILEKVCQAVAFAHSKRIIHRDLKPSNIMVGEFGEVQVMDWGLAKELHADPQMKGMPAAAGNGRVGEGGTHATELSQAGTTLGTLAYMPPEQAVGAWDRVDERADVFALGAMLCEILSGHPPYQATNYQQMLRQAQRGEVSAALERLDQCGAEAALTALCRECLSAEREGRPRNADALARSLAAYQNEVQERLRRAEVERAAAQVKAREERKRRRLALALAALVLLVVVLGGGGVWWQQRQREKADLAVSKGLAQAELLAEQARADPLQTEKYHQALEAARVAAQLAESASAEVRRRAEALLVRLQQEEEAARKDRELLAALLDVRGPDERPKYVSDGRGTLAALAEPSTDEQFASAFRRWGLEVDHVPAAEAAAQLKARPALVVMEVIAALDEWADERRRQGKALAEWQRLAKLAALLDEDPDSKRGELREILARGQLPLERVVGMLSAALRPVPIEVPLGRDHLRLRQLAEQTDAATEPILALLTLVRALDAVGEEARAEQLLRAAILARPREVVLRHALGQLLEAQWPPRWAEAVECFTAARALRPDLGVSLAKALHRSGREAEALALVARLLSAAPKDPYLHFVQGSALQIKGRLDEAMTEYYSAIALDPKDAYSRNNLGVLLHDKGRPEEAMAQYRQSIALAPQNALAHMNLGNALHEKGQTDEAMAEYQKAIALAPENTFVHNNLGNALHEKGQTDRAMAEYRKAMALDPSNAVAHFNLGNLLRIKGRLDEAIAEYRKAIALDPQSASARGNLAGVLRDTGRLNEAMSEYSRALALDPRNSKVHANFGVALRDLGRVDEAIVELRQAIALDPLDASTHYNLGNALHARGQPDEASDEFRQAIRLKPDLAQAHCNLGQMLRHQGRFEESLACYRRGHELGSKQPGWNYPSAEWVHRAEQLLGLDKKLPLILTGDAAPADPDDAINLAWMCQQPSKKCHAASVRLYTDAFAAEPKLAADLNAQHRYNAACSAILAAAGHGDDAHRLPDKVTALFRGRALGWLRDDLTSYARLAGQNNPRASQVIRQRLLRWQREADLLSVRDPQLLARLGEPERTAWQALWRDVDKLLARLK